MTAKLCQAVCVLVQENLASRYTPPGGAVKQWPGRQVIGLVAAEEACELDTQIINVSIGGTILNPLKSGEKQMNAHLSYLMQITLNL
jgi:hypothetical protein